MIDINEFNNLEILKYNHLIMYTNDWNGDFDDTNNLIIIEDYDNENLTSCNVVYNPNNLSKSDIINKCEKLYNIEMDNAIIDITSCLICADVCSTGCPGAYICTATIETTSWIVIIDDYKYNFKGRFNTTDISYNDRILRDFLKKLKMQIRNYIANYVESLL